MTLCRHCIKASFTISKVHLVHEWAITQYPLPSPQTWWNEPQGTLMTKVTLTARPSQRDMQKCQVLLLTVLIVRGSDGETSVAGSDLCPTTIWNRSNSLRVCFSLSEVPSGWELQCWAYSIGSIASAKFYQVQLKYFKGFQTVFEPKSWVCLVLL